MMNRRANHCQKNDDLQRYKSVQKELEKIWEAVCQRCGLCCGVGDGDPCEKLFQDAAGAYYCCVYDQRGGMKKTKAGRPFRCVNIRDILAEDWPGKSQCAYVKRSSEDLLGKKY